MPRFSLRPIVWIVVLLSLPFIAGCASAPDRAPAAAWQTAELPPLITLPPIEADRLLIGFGRQDITPRRPLPLSGYGAYAGKFENARWSQGVHDPLLADALYLRKGEDQLLLIALDLIGLVKPDIDDIRRGIEDRLPISREAVIVSCSHTHHGPDTVGLWGTLFPARSGRDEKYLAWMKQRVIETAVQAAAGARPAQLAVAVGEETELHENIRLDDDPQAPIDHTVTMLVIKDESGKVIGTLTNWGCHPTTEHGQNRLISADWVYYLRRTLAEEYPGAMHFFVNGSIGGAVQPTRQWVTDRFGSEEGGQGFKWAEALGTTFGRRVAALIPQAKPLEFDRIVIRQAPVLAKHNNLVYEIAKRLGVIKMDLPNLYEPIRTQVTAAQMGSLRIGTMPGEMMPDLGNQIRAALGGESQILVGLGQDWMGYVVDYEKWNDRRYAYEKLLCLGPQLGPNVVKAYRALDFE